MNTILVIKTGQVGVCDTTYNNKWPKSQFVI